MKLDSEVRCYDRPAAGGQEVIRIHRTRDAAAKGGHMFRSASWMICVGSGHLRGEDQHSFKFGMAITALRQLGLGIHSV